MTRKRDLDLGWTPIRDGDRFCSLLCGGGCTIDEYNAAMTSARKLVEKLGPDWKPVVWEVWENPGWHYEVRAMRGSLVVRPTRTIFADGFSAIAELNGAEVRTEAKTARGALSRLAAALRSLRARTLNAETAVMRSLR